MTADIIEGDAIGVLSMLDEGSAHCIVTSPPYYGLRDYKVDGQIGMEKTPEEYVARLVAVFREARRVLRDDGTFWLNIGDSYSGSGRGPTGHNGIGNQTERQGFDSQGAIVPDGLKPKDLIGIPWMLAFALRADGWYLRSDIPWIKRNSMPSSVKDRPSSSIEHVFLLSKSKKYYYDYVATMQPSSESYNKDKRPRGVIRQCVNPNSKYPDEGQFKKQDNAGNNTYTGFNARYEDSGTGLRYMRDSDFFFRTWQGLLHNEDGEPMAMVVNPRGYKGAHFACFPVQLVEPMILAGTSEKGVCPACGASWVRDTVKGEFHNQSWGGEHVKGQKAVGGVGSTSCLKSGGTHDIITTGWHPSCQCGIAPISTDMCGIPATVLDPFAGSCATGVACQWHNRNFIGIELNPDYIKLGEKRLLENK